MLRFHPIRSPVSANVYPSSKLLKYLRIYRRGLVAWIVQVSAPHIVRHVGAQARFDLVDALPDIGHRGLHKGPLLLNLGHRVHDPGHADQEERQETSGVGLRERNRSGTGTVHHLPIVTTAEKAEEAKEAKAYSEYPIVEYS